MEDKENFENQEPMENVERETAVETVESVEPQVEQVPEEKQQESVETTKKKKRKKEEEVFDTEGLTDDEIYAKIQTNKLLKKKKNRKIATLTGLCVAFVLAVCLIVMAAVPVSLKPRCIESGFSQVSLYAGSASASFSNEDERYDKFMKYYNNSFSQPYLSALFSGSLFDYNINEIYRAADKNVLSTVMQLAGDGNYVVRLRYNEQQTFTYQNGKPFKSYYGDESWPALTFTDAYFVVNHSEGMQNTSIYVVADYPAPSGETGTVSRLIQVTVKANTNIIYDAWKEFTV